MNDTVFKAVIFHLWRNTLFVLIGMFIWPYLVLKLRSQLELEKLYEWRIWQLVTSKHGSIWIEYMTVCDTSNLRNIFSLAWTLPMFPLLTQQYTNTNLSLSVWAIPAKPHSKAGTAFWNYSKILTSLTFMVMNHILELWTLPFIFIMF